MKTNLYILISIYDLDKVPSDAKYIMIDDLARIAKTKAFFKKVFHYKSVHLLAAELETVPMPFLLGGVCRLMTLGKCEWQDDRQIKAIHLHTMLSLMAGFIYDYCMKKGYLRRLRTELAELNKKEIVATKMKENGTIAYIRSDLPQHLKAGGSLGHIAGVINNLEEVAKCQICFITTEKILSVNTNISTKILAGKIPMRNIPRFLSIASNETYYKALVEIIGDKYPNLIYHRYALESYAVAKYALKHNIPYILEYNGSELWIIKNWQKNNSIADLPFPDISYGIEEFVLKKAALITCVSEPLKEQLLEMGIAEERIAVNPNGVNTDMYTPDIDKNIVREKYSIATEKIVIGFIGTFGAWHGTEKLALAYVKLLSKYNNLHLLMVGDGQKKLQVEEILSVLPTTTYTLTGMIPQNEGSKYLAACDILVSPTIPNTDGTPFFGSPTKLFEYMAMGKAIVCSGMDQMAEVLKEGETALLSKPGDEIDLAEKIEQLIINPELRKQLGMAARRDACENHTWREHTQVIFDKYEKTIKV